MQVPNGPLIQFLRSLHPRYKLATLSNDWPGARQQQNQLFQLEQMLGVDAMLYSCEEGMQKPQADFYLLACERLEVHPEEVVFVDDREQCVQTAQQLGMRGILFQETAQVIAEIQACLDASAGSKGRTGICGVDAPAAPAHTACESWLLQTGTVSFTASEHAVAGSTREPVARSRLVACDHAL